MRKREGALREQYENQRLWSDESTHHYSSQDREQAFIEAQFPTSQLLERYQSYRQEWHRRAGEMDAGDVPLAVIIELASACNLRCRMCYTRTPEFQASVIGAQRMLPWDTVVRLVDECADIGVCSLLFSWRGESGLYRSRGSDGVMRDLADALQYARQQGILEVTILTNGRSLDDALIERIVMAEPNWISFSIDGLHDAYDKIRGTAPNDAERRPFDVVIENLRKLVQTRNRLGLERPQVRTNTVYPPIARNPDEYRRFMEGLGVGLVTVNEMLDFRGEELPEDAILDDWFCPYSFQRLVVSANGVILPCPGAHNEDKEMVLVVSANGVILPCPGAHNEDKEMVLGRYTGSAPKKVVRDGVESITDYPEITLREAWNCERIQAIRAAHRENRRTQILTCRRCRHGARTDGVDKVPEDWDMERMDWADRKWRT